MFTEVDAQTWSLVGATAMSGWVAVNGVRQGFAELDFPGHPCLLALDFLPPCRAGDVLKLRRHRGRVRIAVDLAATARAQKKLLRLWSLLRA